MGQIRADAANNLAAMHAGSRAADLSSDGLLRVTTMHQTANTETSRTPDSVVLVWSGAGVLTSVLTPDTGPSPGWVDFPFGMTPEVFLLELRGVAAVFTQRIR
jgi:hypothetical protein